MKNKIFAFIAGQIILLAAILIVVSYLTDYLQQSGFFGDTKFVSKFIRKTSEYSYYTTNDGSILDSDWTWGYRHYVYFWMGILLFLTSIFRVIFTIADYVEKIERNNHD